MNHDEIANLLPRHAALRLLRAVNAPLIAGFLHAVFVVPNRRSILATELVARLDDYLDSLRQPPHENRYTNTAREYLEDWASGSAALLRKYYPARGDEPEFDLSVGAEKALEWLESLKPRPFAGTESRLMTLFNLLRELVRESEADTCARIAALTARREELDREIERVRGGRVEPMSDTRVKERYFELEDTARRLLGDFRQIEENFRALDQRTRETITVGVQPKGRLLDAVFGEQDYIRASDQGQSFAAFWDLLMSPERQDELAKLLDATHLLSPVAGLDRSGIVEEMPRALLAAGERVHQTASLLVAQLRRFLDDRAALENRRIVELVAKIEQQALALREHMPAGDFVQLDHLRPEFHLPLARPLFSPPQAMVLAAADVLPGEPNAPLDALLAHAAVDEAQLEEQIRSLLREHSQISLGAITRHYPPRHGVAEIVAYLTLASRDGRALIDEQIQELIDLPAREGPVRRLRVPKVVFVR